MPIHFVSPSDNYNSLPVMHLAHRHPLCLLLQKTRVIRHQRIIPLLKMRRIIKSVLVCNSVAGLAPSMVSLQPPQPTILSNNGSLTGCLLISSLSLCLDSTSASPKLSAAHVHVAESSRQNTGSQIPYTLHFL